MFRFEVEVTDKRAQVGKLITPHGTVQTPVFLPVGTQASVKSLTSQDLKDIGVEMILANTYHLYLRPGADTVAKLGGLHKFMNWDRPILTDSGGFQVFSLGFGIEHEVGKMTQLFSGEVVGDLRNLSNLRNLIPRTKLCKIEEEGPTFQSHLDGSVHFFPPEKSVETQVKLGADFIVALDECTSPLHNYDYTKISMERSHRWEKRSLDHFKHSMFDARNSMFDAEARKLKLENLTSNFQHQNLVSSLQSPASKQQIFGVVQGGPFEDLRIQSAKFVSENDFFGVGIGGALVSKEKMREILDWIHPHLHPQKPRHLLGIGTVDDIFEGVERGMDIFDCVSPTRMARTGHLLANIRYKKEERRKFTLDINKSEYRESMEPVEKGCGCYTCQNYTRAYLNHLFRARELLAYRLATIHNLYFMERLMAQIREAIANKTFAKLKQNWLN